MLEIEYAIGAIKTSMFVAENHTFSLITEEWIKAENLKKGDKISARCGDAAEILQLKKTEGPHHFDNLKVSHNHHYFVTTASMPSHHSACDKAPINALELIPYNLANKPSTLPNGKSTGHHAGPWVAAKYVCRDSCKEVIGLGCADDLMCAEDAAVSDLINKLGANIQLHRGNVEISHAYIRKYSKKGRLVNTMSPCTHCRENYGDALNDSTMGTSNVIKNHRGYLPPVKE